MTPEQDELKRYRFPGVHGDFASYSEAAATITALRAERDDYKEAYEDTRRLAREIDVAMHGEEGAAKQASLCDLVHPAQLLRAERNRLAVALTEKRRDRIADSELSGAYLCRAETAEKERDDLKSDYLRVHKDKIDYLEKNLALEKEVERLKKALTKYGTHANECSGRYGPECNCGWRETEW